MNARCERVTAAGRLWVRSGTGWLNTDGGVVRRATMSQLRAYPDFTPDV